MKRVCLTFLFLILLSQTVFAEEINFISQPGNSMANKTLSWQTPGQYRPAILLDGSWEYWTSKKNPWKKVELPASCDYLGEITFQRFFTADSSLKNHHVRLVCYGINYYCEFFINNKFIGSHSGGYNSFFIDIGDGILFFDQQNQIEIKVNTRLDTKNTIPPKFQPNGFKETFGIFRSLYFLALPEISIENPKVITRLNTNFSTCELAINFDLKNKSKNFFNYKKTKSSTSELQYQIELYSNETGTLILRHSKKIGYDPNQLTTPVSENMTLKKPNLWSPETPHLYSLLIKLMSGQQILDQINISLGIKQLDFFKGTVFLNGEHYFVKGVNWVEDYLVDGAVFSKDQLMKDLLLIKQLNANAIRVVNHPAHPFLSNACDSLGLFLLQDLPLKQVPQQWLKSNKFITVFQNYLSETIFRDRAHVSVFALGIGGNYLTTDLSSATLLEDLIQNSKFSKNLPIYTYCSPPFSQNRSLFSIIHGISIFNFGKGKVQEALSDWMNKNELTPCFVFSYGAPKYGNKKNVESDVKFQQYQVQQIVNAWQVIKSYPEIDGCFINALFDYYGNYPSIIYGNSVNSSTRPVGLVDHQRKKRFSFEAVKSLYREGNWRCNTDIDFNNEQPWIFPLVGLVLLIFLLFTVNRRRYFKENFKRIYIHPHGFYTDLRDGRKIPTSHTFLIAFFISGGCGLVLASLLYFLKQSFVVDHLLTLLFPNDVLKNYLSNIAWQPGLLIVMFSILIILFFILLSLIIRLISLISKKRFSIGKALTLSFWLGGNYVIYIPVGMVFFRLLQHKTLTGFLIAFLLFIDLWFVFRVIKGIRVVFSWTYVRSIVVTMATIFVFTISTLYYYQINYALVDYLKYYYFVYWDQLVSLLF